MLFCYTKHMNTHDHHNHHNHGHHENPNLTGMSDALNPLGHKFTDYIPLLIVFGFIGLSSWILVSLTENMLLTWLNAIMGFFFLFFSLFKLINLQGFKDGYSDYDLIAMRFKGWGYLYPFIELALGVLFLLQIVSTSLYVVTIAVSALAVLSVAIKLARHEKFMCMCLGTTLKVPLTTVTLIEYGLMGAMAIWMLFL